MIVEPSKEFNYQLTVGKELPSQLEFALKQFENNDKADCCIKKCDVTDLFSVYTKGFNYPLFEAKRTEKAEHPPKVVKPEATEVQ